MLYATATESADCCSASSVSSRRHYAACCRTVLQNRHRVGSVRFEYSLCMADTSSGAEGLSLANCSSDAVHAGVWAVRRRVRRVPSNALHSSGHLLPRPQLHVLRTKHPSCDSRESRPGILCGTPCLFKPAQSPEVHCRYGDRIVIWTECCAGSQYRMLSQTCNADQQRNLPTGVPVCSDRSVRAHCPLLSCHNDELTVNHARGLCCAPGIMRRAAD